ncbi:hypothetical protein Lal_00010132 [Lupinus albus]|uniref:Putative transcription factor bHLH family n=1 Tax=Lupinus albus TaxID=3870 RepID=A0A6A4NGT6_LUPAL|nr:putative transcription factor bHLH family [Lupinus albus]KAF1859548.1 hypothetical protein Lal_00010132 [Lupinus albus]
MMAGNPNWWSMHPASLIPPQYVLGSSSNPFNSLAENQEPPQSWSQLFFTGLPGEDESMGLSHFQSKKLGNWDEQIDLDPSSRVPILDIIKQEVSQSSSLYGHEDFHAGGSSWSNMVPISSPKSCVTSSFSSNSILDLITYNKVDQRKINQLPDQISKCNSTDTVGVSKKARVHQSSSQPPLKVRKEKLGDRITALHQLVSPCGKTDTASVLLEAIGYIRFLQAQIQALTSPYLDNNNASKNIRNQDYVHGETNLIFPEDPGQDREDKAKELKSRGLCLVPLSCTHHVESENGTHYWLP